MKKLILIIAVIWIGCGDKGAADMSLKDFTVKVTYPDNTSDTFKVKSITEPFLDNGEVGINYEVGVFSFRTKIIASGARSIKLLQ